MKTWAPPPQQGSEPPGQPHQPKPASPDTAPTVSASQRSAGGGWSGRWDAHRERLGYPGRFRRIRPAGLPTGRRGRFDGRKLGNLVSASVLTDALKSTYTEIMISFSVSTEIS